MKNALLKILVTILTLTVASTTSAQEPAFGPADSLRTTTRPILPDTLVHPTPWHPDFMAQERLRTQPAVSMTSVVEIRQENLPRRIVVLDNNTLQLGQYLTLSNGQAWHWGPFLNAFLDARTLSFPLPR